MIHLPSALGQLRTSTLTPHGGWFMTSPWCLRAMSDIAGVIAFLTTDEARWITGDTLRVDGGSKL